MTPKKTFTSARFVDVPNPLPFKGPKIPILGDALNPFNYALLPLKATMFQMKLAGKLFKGAVGGNMSSIIMIGIAILVIFMLIGFFRRKSSQVPMQAPFMYPQSPFMYPQAPLMSHIPQYSHPLTSYKSAFP